jgi:hypothetical protein
LVALAEAAVRSQPENPDCRVSLGTALYRAGSYQQAVEQLTQDAAAGPEGVPECAKLFLAMAQHRLGNREEGRRGLHQSSPYRSLGLQRAVEALAAAAGGVLPALGRLGASVTQVPASRWDDQLILRHLYLEAESTLRSPAR